MQYRDAVEITKTVMSSIYPSEDNENKPVVVNNQMVKRITAEQAQEYLELVSNVLSTYIVQGPAVPAPAGKISKSHDENMYCEMDGYCLHYWEASKNPDIKRVYINRQDDRRNIGFVTIKKVELEIQVPSKVISTARSMIVANQ